MVSWHKVGFTGLMVGSLISLAGCGSTTKPAYPAVTVKVASDEPLSKIPFEVATRLGFFSKVTIQWSQTSASQLRVASPSPNSPILGYLVVRPNLELLAPIPDPHFRLRSLNNLPMVISQSATHEQPLAERVFSAHRAHVRRYEVLSLNEIERLWRRHHLPWVLVTLNEAQKLKSLDAHSVVLAWIGASTGPIPVEVLTARSSSHIPSVLHGLNMALWYLNTTPAKKIAEVLGQPDLAAAIRQARRYNLWPSTTLPDESTYIRGQRWFSDWPPYQTAVNPKLARQALLRALK